jgi:hypothetical protein
MEKGGTDNAGADGTGGADIAGILRGPPALFNAPATEKWAREVEALITAPEAAMVTLALLVDGSEADTKSLSVAQATNNQPKRVRSRVSGRGLTVQGEIRATTAGLKVAGLTPWAEVRRRRF